MSEKIVLAFSGGLDTSYCVLDLVQKGYEVHTAFIDTGGVDEAGRSYIRERAASLGAAQHHEIEAAQEIWALSRLPNRRCGVLCRRRERHPGFATSRVLQYLP